MKEDAIPAINISVAGVELSERGIGTHNIVSGHKKRPQNSGSNEVEGVPILKGKWRHHVCDAWDAVCSHHMAKLYSLSRRSYKPRIFGWLDTMILLCLLNSDQR